MTGSCLPSFRAVLIARMAPRQCSPDLAWAAAGVVTAKEGCDGRRSHATAAIDTHPSAGCGEAKESFEPYGLDADLPREIDQVGLATEGIGDACRAQRSDCLVLCHGGPIAEPQDAQYVLDRGGLDGFFAARLRRRPQVARY